MSGEKERARARASEREPPSPSPSPHSQSFTTLATMARLPWRRTLHLLKGSSLLPPPAASPAAPLCEELCSKTTLWTLSTRSAHISSQDQRSGGCSQVPGTRIGDEWVMRDACSEKNVIPQKQMLPSQSMGIPNPEGFPKVCRTMCRGMVPCGQTSSLGVRRFAAVASMGESDLTGGEGDDLVQIEEAREVGVGEDSQVEDGLAMFASTSSLTDVTGTDVMKYITFSEEDQLKYFGEGLPRGVAKEFEATKANSLMIRPKVLQLCNLLERHVTGKDAFELPAEGANVLKPKKHILLDGPEGSGKSVALAMLVQWARARGWLVFYIPSGRGWTHGSLYYRNEETGLVETPVTAQMALEGFLKSHSELLGTLPCNIPDPVPLGEGAGVPRVRGPQEFTLPEGATLKQLVEKGLSMSHAGVGTVVRLRKELSLVKDVPVLIAIDDYNSWFVFTEYGVKAKKPIHAHQLEMVRAFRPMAGSTEMMVTAFSHSNAVGKLPQQLPDVPKGVRFDFPRYSPVEASTALQYYHSRKLTAQEPGDADVVRLYYLTGGNGKEIRNLSRFI